MVFVNLLLDALLLALVVHGIMTGWLRGFVRVVFMRMRRLTSLIIAFFAARPLGALIGERYFEHSLAGKLRELLVSAFGEGTSDVTAAQLADELPTLLRGALHIFGVDADRIALETEATGGALPDAFAERIASPAAHILGAIVAFVCVYFLARLLLRFVVHLVSAVFCLPGLRILNKVLGLLAGLLFALFSAWLLITLLAFLFDLLAGNGVAFFAGFDIEKTYFAKYFYRLKPLELLLAL